LLLGGYVSRRVLWTLSLLCHRRGHRFFFFFSSRRRHTRSKRDWSSDVCSSDLSVKTIADASRATSVPVLPIAIPTSARRKAGARSEERRVGKECRSRWRR